jgi:hypothetical protein
MSTTPMTTFQVDLATLGPIYPFVGWEVPLVILAFLFWIAFHVWQIRFEDRTYHAELHKLRSPDRLEKALRNHER